MNDYTITMTTSGQYVLPVPAKNIRKAYDQLVAEIDAMADQLGRARFSTILQCGPGCSECCIRFSILPLEAAIVAWELQLVDQLQEHDEEKCRLLASELCLVYNVRPIICRTQGLPLGYVDEEAGTIEVSACHRNFPADFPFAHEDLLYMQDFNERLAALNFEYCQSAGLDPRKRIRSRISIFQS